MFPLLELPHEIIAIILDSINSSQDFFNVVQTCKLIYFLSPIKEKRIAFLKEIVRIETLEEYVISKKVYFVLPNGSKEGLYQKYIEINNSRINILDTICHYVNGKKEGLRKKYSAQDFFKPLTEDNNYSLEYEKNYHNGRLHGISRFFLHNGNIYYEENYESGVKEGIQRRWFYYSTGKLASYVELNFTSGQQNGPTRTWNVHDNKLVLRYENYYTYGIKNGSYREWDSSGRIIRLDNYKDGKKCGLTYTWSYSDCGSTTLIVYELDNNEIIKSSYIYKVNKDGELFPE